ncbi:hypothetical protein WG904_08260 [Pedobacter sp. Du54]|uniref:hypothetical protein n=1 Tax=Pedobacter anseongensis TaxID=3133439 RepID=UPI00309FFAAE
MDEVLQKIYLWSPFGYEEGKEISALTRVEVLTPRSVVNAIREGYAFQIAFS